MFVSIPVADLPTGLDVEEGVPLARRAAESRVLAEDPSDGKG